MDGVLGIEAKMFLKELSRKISLKWDRDVSEVYNFVKARISVAIARASYYCIRGSRLHASYLGFYGGLWEDGSALEQFGYLD